MRFVLIIALSVLLTFSVSTASSDKEIKEDRYKNREYERRYDDLKDQFYELKYDMRQQLRYQNKFIDEQAELITELRLKIKAMDSDLFQTTQSLRNLELEVWDMKKSSNN